MNKIIKIKNNIERKSGHKFIYDYTFLPYAEFIKTERRYIDYSLKEINIKSYCSDFLNLNYLAKMCETKGNGRSIASKSIYYKCSNCGIGLLFFKCLWPKYSFWYNYYLYEKDDIISYISCNSNIIKNIIE